MKSPLLVILPSGCSAPFDDLRATLEHFRLNEDNERSIENHHWDYWIFPTESSINQTEILKLFPDLPPELSGNIGIVSRLDADRHWSAVITPDIQWHDIADFGWRMTRHPCHENEVAERAWASHYRSLLKSYPDQLAAGVIVHC